jgi:PAS domain S-box-containing protein/putative nucleotidyltransferase with HDIG domain
MATGDDPMPANSECLILIVDDDADFRDNLSGILRQEGYMPLPAATGREALERSREHGVAVALIDLKLGDMSGIEVLKGIKEHSPATEGIFVTGYASQSSAIDALNMDAYRYVEKPFDMGRLLGMIRRAIEKRDLARALRESEERYRTLFEESRDAIFITSPGNRFIQFNQASLDLLGYAREELMQLLPSDIFVDINDFRRIDREIQNRGYVKDYEVTFRCRERECVDCLISSTGRLIDACNILEYQTIVKDITKQKKIQRQLENTLDLLRDNLNGVIKLVTQLVEKKDPYTAGHQLRVTDLARAIAQEMNLPSAQVDAIRMAGRVHDIGKISLPAEILNKPGPLSEAEMSLLKAHSRIGYDILREIEWPHPIPDIVLQHHERMDGSGYPQGLSGEDILIEARILGVADVVESMNSFRPYRPSLGLERAIEEIVENRGTLYDPDVVDACIRLFKEKGFRWHDEQARPEVYHPVNETP